MNTLDLTSCSFSVPAGSISIPVEEQSQVGDARRQTARLVQELGFDGRACGKVAIIVTELATNLVRYAIRGRIVAQASMVGAELQIDILSLDHGPGIKDIPRSLRDGFSTGGTPGNGLGAVSRLSDEFDFYSNETRGTAIFSRVLSSRGTQESVASVVRPYQWSCVGLPAPGEILSGDAWRIATQNDQLSILFVDGLGHGPEAAAASDEACAAFHAAPFAPLHSIMQTADARMRGTRGGAIAVGQINFSSAQMKYIGYGNIGGAIRNERGEEGRGLVSHNGTAGVMTRHGREFDYICPKSGLLLMYSDGLQSRYSFDHYPGLAQRHPAVIAGVLLRDFTRGRDDVTVGVLRFPGSENLTNT